jgi:hypothetical protein
MSLLCVRSNALLGRERTVVNVAVALLNAGLVSCPNHDSPSIRTSETGLANNRNRSDVLGASAVN